MTEKVKRGDIVGVRGKPGELDINILFLAYQIRFSAIFTSTDKSYLAYPYQTHGI